MTFIPIDPVLAADCADALRLRWYRVKGRHVAMTNQGPSIDRTYENADFLEIAEIVIRRAAERGRITERGWA